jgi:hypothetical protein
MCMKGPSVLYTRAPSKRLRVKSRCSSCFFFAFSHFKQASILILDKADGLVLHLKRGNIQIPITHIKSLVSISGANKWLGIITTFYGCGLSQDNWSQWSACIALRRLQAEYRACLCWRWSWISSERPRAGTWVGHYFR